MSENYSSETKTAVIGSNSCQQDKQTAKEPKQYKEPYQQYRMKYSRLQVIVSTKANRR